MKAIPQETILLIGFQQRVLAFRVWHIPSASMWQVSMFNDRHVYRKPRSVELVDGASYFALDVPFNRADCVLMQQTEYSDRNGLPLFEGDILRIDQVLCQADRESALESQPDIDPEYSCYEYISRYRGALKLTGLGETIDHKDSTYWYGWLHEEQDFVDEANLWLHRTLAGNLYEHPEIAAQTGCFPLHPDHIRDYDEHTSNQ